MNRRKTVIPVGESAPDFTATASDGTTVQLSALRGRWVVLIFYPGDNTPVCTAQLCSFRDNWEELKAADAVVYGINPASKEKHRQFAARQEFPFPLLADPGGRIAAAYGCRGLFGFIRRTVYILDRQGNVAWVQRGQPAPASILDFLHSMQDAG